MPRIGLHFLPALFEDQFSVQQSEAAPINPLASARFVDQIAHRSAFACQAVPIALNK
ncbi:hypothetical protein SynBIOSE41_03784 [Synechococcus sp. BIOS-E4-1]|nr:hypothetical protein SynBIOSE41_03784 [Synechococcus sp. BIOS-E4-1]